MRPDREQLLQNLLAMGSTLLFRCSKAMAENDRVLQLTLVAECEIYFSEALSSLSAAHSEDTTAVSFASAPPVVSYGEKLSWGPPGSGLSLPSDVPNTEIASIVAGVSPSASPGTRTDCKTSPHGNSSENSALNFFLMK